MTADDPSPFSFENCLRRAQDARERAAVATSAEDIQAYSELAEIWQQMAEAMKKNGLTSLLDPKAR